LDGRVRVQIGDEAFDVPAGRLIAFNSGVRHSIDALEDSTLLLTLTGVGS
jgi:quercetin dioxygenase-like cupin family protein